MLWQVLFAMSEKMIAVKQGYLVTTVAGLVIIGVFTYLWTTLPEKIKENSNDLKKLEQSIDDNFNRLEQSLASTAKDMEYLRKAFNEDFPRIQAQVYSNTKDIQQIQNTRFTSAEAKELQAATDAKIRVYIDGIKTGINNIADLHSENADDIREMRGKVMDMDKRLTIMEMNNGKPLQ